MSIDATLIKRGEICITVNLQRHKNGLAIQVKTHPAVEEYIKSLGQDEAPIDVQTLGRHWQPIRKDDKLMVYNLSKENRINTTISGVHIRGDRVGLPLTERSMSPITGQESDIINLSFLRLVGTSEGDGVGFTIRGVHTLDSIRKLGEQIKEASRLFYITYMKPVDLTVMVSTQEM